MMTQMIYKQMIVYKSFVYILIIHVSECSTIINKYRLVIVFREYFTILNCLREDKSSEEIDLAQNIQFIFE